MRPRSTGSTHPARRGAALRSLLVADVDRYAHMLELDGTLAGLGSGRVASRLRAFALCRGLQAVVVHRVSHAVWHWQPARSAGRLVQLVVRVLLWLLTQHVVTRTGVSIAQRARIGAGLYIGHEGGVVIGEVDLGANTTLSHGVTIGRSGRRGEDARPRFGDRCWVGPGAVVSGDLDVGDDVVIGANTVLTRSVPARSTALGAPARVRRHAGSFAMVVYPGSDRDDARTASLERLAVEEAHDLGRTSVSTT